MKIAVIGTFLYDDIILLNGKSTKSLGGITYSISVLANLLTKDDIIYPIANVGNDMYIDITKYLSQYNNVSLKGLNNVNKPNTRVSLKYFSKESREEILKNQLPPISIRQVDSIDKVDAILINFITGFELTRETCNKICKCNNALIYMDIHSLCLGIDDHGKRFPQIPFNWWKWLAGVDILQMNENEARTLNESNCSTSLKQKFIEYNVSIVNITLGSKGSMLIQKNKKNIPISPFEVEKVSDVTGCGDAFSAGFLINFINNKNYYKAALNANKIAAFNSTLIGLDQINKLKLFAKKINSHQEFL